jgi:threonine/homoserine/homoserine lactone efflux protein
VGADRAAGNPFWQGMLTEVLNPKTALFFLAFIPQFVNHSTPVVPQFLALGALSVTLNTMADVAVVLAAGSLERRLKSSMLWRRRQRQASGVALIGLGGYVALS